MELPLQISRSGGFHSRVDEAFSAGHAVKEKLLMTKRYKKKSENICFFYSEKQILAFTNIIV